MSVHVVSLPHTQTTRDYVWCAYTEKVRKFCNMMMDQGHEVYLYAGEQNEARCTEHIVVATDEMQEKHFGHIDWDTEVFSGWDPQAPWWIEMNGNAAIAIAERSEPGDFLGLIAGRCQQSLQAAFPGMITVEWGIGYEGVLYGTHKVFESRAWQHYVYGTLRDDDGHFYDTVIPNSFDLKDFKFGTEKDDYLLFLGRHTPRKGLDIVAEIAKHHRVITAGQGDLRVPGTEYVGVVRGDQKADLLSRARGLLVPTLYLEPFGGVAVEAMLSGTPVITTDWGAFPETVIQGRTGFRCKSLREFLDAANDVDDIMPQRCRLHAFQYTTEEVAPLYGEYFDHLSTLTGDGWYAGV